jgi:uncharacterized protein (DUF4415 family)
MSDTKIVDVKITRDVVVDLFKNHGINFQEIKETIRNIVADEGGKAEIEIVD